MRENVCVRERERGKREREGERERGRGREREMRGDAKGGIGGEKCYGIDS